MYSLQGSKRSKDFFDLCGFAVHLFLMRIARAPPKGTPDVQNMPHVICVAIYGAICGLLKKLTP
jgi:hypothetical protein